VVAVTALAVNTVAMLVPVQCGEFVLTAYSGQSCGPTAAEVEFSAKIFFV
jgi:hypothetical protein